MQKVIIVDRDGLTTLNEWLKDGWKVVNTCPMPSGDTFAWPTCLVVVEKDE